MSKLTVNDYFSIYYYLTIFGLIVFMFHAGLVGAIKPLIAEIIWLFAWGILLAYEVSLIGKDAYFENSVSKLTVNDYFSIAYYLTIFGFIVFMFYGGLVGAIKPLIAEIIWLFAWGILLAYEVSLIGKDAYFENSEFR